MNKSEFLLLLYCDQIYSSKGLIFFLFHVKSAQIWQSITLLWSPEGHQDLEDEQWDAIKGRHLMFLSWFLGGV